MPTDYVIYLSIPGLRPRDVTRDQTPTLHAWAGAGALADLVPTFPCVTSPVQATQWTGAGPDVHGVIANGFYHRDRGVVEFWVGRNGVVGGEQIWDAIRPRRPGFTSAVWHAQNIKDCAADFIITPAPIHEADGTTRLWCYSKPDGLYQEMRGELGHFPLQHYWGPLSNIESSRWILSGASRLIARHAPNLHWIYLPHLDYAAQKFGPDSPQAQASLTELDQELARFADGVAESEIGGRVVFVAAGEYAMTDVSGVIYPNLLLREAGLLKVRKEDGAEQIDLAGSAAFAMVDHQFAHVYLGETSKRRNVETSKRRQQATGNGQQGRTAEGSVRSGRQAPALGRPGVSSAQLLERTLDVFQSIPGLTVYAGDDRAKIGMNHPRSGEIVLVCDESHWLAYYWWFEDAKAPAYARTVDIHRKPGFDPVELFFDPKTKSIPLDATLVKGSHGAPATSAHQHAALISSAATRHIESGKTYRDTDIKAMTLGLLMD
jgi:hypothetical protein